MSTDRRVADTAGDAGTDAAAVPADGSGTSPDWRERLRTSRFGGAGVLLVTALLVMGGAWLIQSTTGVGDVTEVTTTGAAGPPPEIGGPAHDFTARTIDGQEVSLSDYEGRPVWVLFGASWCASCRAEAPDVEAVYAQAQEQGVEIVSVYLGEDAMTVRDYTSSAGLTYLHVPDPATSVSSAYRVMGIPAHYFIDPQGRIASIQVGAIDRGQMEQSISDIAG